MAQIDARAALNTRLHLLAGDCAGYDDGDHARALMIALHVRVLLYQKAGTTQKNHPILRQINEQFMDAIQLASVIGPDEESRSSAAGVFFHYGLVEFFGRINEVAQFAPRLSSIENATFPVRHWWEGQRVITIDGVPYTRRQIVMTFADQVAAHSDREFNDQVERDLIADPNVRGQAREAIARALPFFPMGLRDLYLPALRAIGYEILASKSLTEI